MCFLGGSGQLVGVASAQLDSRAWAHGDGLRVGVMSYMKPSCHPGQLTLLGDPLKVLTEVLGPIFGLTVLFGKDARDGVGSGWRR
jgi:hypothetical protein